MATQTILITGSSSGLGNALARSFLEHGHTVAATMRNLNTKNVDVARVLQTFADTTSGTLHLIEMDVSRDDSVQQAIQTAHDTLTKLDVVINNAGVGGGGLTEAFSIDQLEHTLNVNVLGVHRVMRAVLPQMRQRGAGLIINVSSAMGRMVVPFAGPYTASKYAIEGLSESYRYELANTGVDVVIVEPGGFMTNYWSSMMQPTDTARVDSYGDIAQMPDALWQGIPSMLSDADAAKPDEFAKALLELINTPQGERPIRLVVDPVTGGDAPKAINAVSENVQKQVLEAFGLTDLLSAFPASKS